MATQFKRPPSGHLRLGIAVLAGVIACWVATFFLIFPMSLLVGLVFMAGLFVAASFAVLWPMSWKRTSANANREDFNPLLEETLVVTVALAGLVGIVVILLRGQDHERNAAAALGLVGIFLSWAMLHLMYGARYAHLYYSDPKGGIDFNSSDPPRYVDFLYMAFTLGMTYAVSDTNVSHTDIRAVVTRHALLSYVFGTVVLAAAINLVLGVVGGG